MVTVGSYEAKTRLSALLAKVEAGESVIITRHGREIARLVPPPPKPENEALKKALAEWRKARKGMRLNGLKVKDLINEGRR